MNEEQLKERVEREAKIQAEGLAALRDAHVEHLHSVNAWHESREILLETPYNHPLRQAARRNESDAVRECANNAAIVFLEESKLDGMDIT